MLHAPSGRIDGSVVTHGGLWLAQEDDMAWHESLMMPIRWCDEMVEWQWQTQLAFLRNQWAQIYVTCGTSSWDSMWYDDVMLMLADMWLWLLRNRSHGLMVYNQRAMEYKKWWQGHIFEVIWSDSFQNPWLKTSTPRLAHIRQVTQINI